MLQYLCAFFSLVYLLYAVFAVVSKVNSEALEVILRLVAADCPLDQEIHFCLYY